MKYVWIFLLMLWSSIVFAQMVVKRIVHDGTMREYAVFVPRSYPSIEPCPVVVNFHGDGYSGSQQAAMSSFNSIADTANCIVVYPEALPDGAGVQRWHPEASSAIDDVGFIDRLLDTLSADYRIDSDKVYAIGFSTGGAFCYTLSCRLSHRFGGMAIVSGALRRDLFHSCSTDPMPFLQIHGTSDTIIPQHGNTTYISVHEVIRYWTQRNGTDTVGVYISLANIVLNDQSTVDVGQFHSSSCYPLNQIIVNNGGHSWPGSGLFISGNTNMDFSASHTIWGFLAHSNCITSAHELPSKPRLKTYVATLTQTLHWEGEASDRYTLTIYNASGQAVARVAAGQSYYSLVALPRGWYLAVWEDQHRRHLQAFIRP